MATKTLEQIVEIIETGTPQWVESAKNEHLRLDVHINGKNTAKYLTVIDNIENQNQFFLRQKFLTTNRHLFTTLARPIDKVFSAKGGGNIYNIKQEPKEKTLKTKLSNLRHGKNIRSWIKDIQSNKYYTDPCGLVFFEWSNNKTYPTVKSINIIQNYETDGRIPEWVLFEPTKEVVNGKETGAKIYRFIDDSYDYLIKEMNGAYTEVEGSKYKNPFKVVPAIINSEIINSDLTHAESPFEIIISLADHYLRTGTIKNLNEFLHGYPIFWRYLTDCKSCKGTGLIEGETCRACNGSGKNLNKDITDIIQIETPESDEAKLAPDLAGYVTPDIASLQQMHDTQEQLMAICELTMWGSKMVKDSSNETATAAFINVQPVNDRLNAFSDSFEDLEKKMTDLVGVFYLKSYEGSSISYGRRFLVELPDVIWKKYESAREKGVSKVALDYLLIQFYQSEYSNDIENMSIAMKGIKLEPFIHKTDEELISLPVSADDKKAKVYFNEWFKSVSEFELLSKDISELNKMFEQYLTTINPAIEPQNKQDGTNVQ